MRRFLLGSIFFLLFPTISQAETSQLGIANCDGRNGEYYYFQVRAMLLGQKPMDEMDPPLSNVTKAEYVELLLNGNRVGYWNNVPVIKNRGWDLLLSAGDIDELYIHWDDEMSAGDSYLQLRYKETLELFCSFEPR